MFLSILFKKCKKHSKEPKEFDLENQMEKTEIVEPTVENSIFEIIKNQHLI